MEEKMDITLDIEKYRLNIRAGGIIIHNHKLLVHKDKRENYYALIGGRVAIGENSIQTIEREIQEEIGKEVEVTGYIATIENFFKANERNYHEILFVHKLEFKKEEDKKIESTLPNIEGKEYLQYEWIELDKLDQYCILPECIKPILKEGKFPIHKINEE